MNVFLTDTAIDQLAHIHRYIVEKNGYVQVADKLVKDIVNGASALLAFSPKAGRRLNSDNERFIVI